MESEITHGIFNNITPIHDFGKFCTFVSLFNLCHTAKMKRVTFDKLFTLFSRKFIFHINTSRHPFGVYNPQFHVTIFEKMKWSTIQHTFITMDKSMVKYYGLRENLYGDHFIRGENFDTKYKANCKFCRI